MVVDLFDEEIGTFDLPGLQCVDGRSMPQHPLWHVLIVQGQAPIPLKETLIYWLRRRIAALRGARVLAYLLDMSRTLCSVRLALHPPRALNQHLLNPPEQIVHVQGGR